MALSSLPIEALVMIVLIKTLMESVMTTSTGMITHLASLRPRQE